MQIYFACVTTIVSVYFVTIFGHSSELRCHCNLPSCVKTSNGMCKSVLGCFQELPSSANQKQQRLQHGCLELWPSNRPYQCAADVNGGDEILVRPIYSENDKKTILSSVRTSADNKDGSNHHRRPSTIPLRCCLEDMCNFAVGNFLPTNLNNDSRSLELNVLLVRDNSGDVVSIAKTPNSTTIIVRSAWFTAALIIVPVLGIFVLFLLIIFGCYLLKFDTKQDSDIVVDQEDGRCYYLDSLLSSNNNNNNNSNNNKNNYDYDYDLVAADVKRKQFCGAKLNSNMNFAPLLSVIVANTCQAPVGVHRNYSVDLLSTASSDVGFLHSSSSSRSTKSESVLM